METEITESEVGWVLYDGDCPLCRRWAGRLKPVLEPQGFRFDTLQSCWAVARLGLNPEARPAEMIVIPAEGAPLGGGDAVIHLSKSIWWARPLAWLARLPGGRALIRRGYRDIAARRQCIGVCKTPPSPVTTRRSRREEAHFSNGSGTRSVFPEDQSLLTSTPTSDVNRHSDAWLPLLLLPFITLAFQSYLPAWVFMWLLAFALFAGCKWLTFRLAIAGFQHPKPSMHRKLAYLLAWPGMDGNEFLRTENAVARPTLREWLLAVLKTLLGVLLIWRVAPILPPAQPIIVGWTGMGGVVFILHFGLFHLLSLIWRHQGVNARPLMQAPLLATSLADFWGRRWNTAFHELVHRFAFRRLVRNIGARGAMLLVFLISGLIHDLVISLPARGGYGLPTLYFLIQGTGLLIERTRVGRRLGLGAGWRGRIFTWLVTVLPVGILFHPPFIHQVILPMLRAIGAIAN